MNTKVEFYSILRDLIGAGELDVSLSEGTTVAGLLTELYGRYPKLAEWDGRLLLAADLDYVDRSHAIQPGEVISVMPPVQGG
jgi:molybdopterin synthase sulfur carrier subunit